jgi:hypothetical protein
LGLIPIPVKIRPTLTNAPKGTPTTVIEVIIVKILKNFKIFCLQIKKI